MLIRASSHRNKVEDFFDRVDLEPGLAVAGKAKKSDSLNYSRWANIVDSENLEYGFRVIFAGCPSFFGFGTRGLSYSNFLASTVQGA